MACGKNNSYNVYNVQDYIFGSPFGSMGKRHSVFWCILDMVYTLYVQIFIATADVCTVQGMLHAQSSGLQNLVI